MNEASMNPQDDVLGLTDDYVNGLLSDVQIRFVDERVASSPVWRAALDEARARAAAVRSVPEKEPAEALFVRAFESANLQQRRSTRTRRVFTRVIPACFAAAAAILLLVQLYFQTLSPGGHDLMVLGQTALAAGGPGSLRVRLLDRPGGNPISGAAVDVTLADPNGKTVTLASFKTDSRGTGSPRYTLPDWDEGEYRIRITAAGRETVERTVTLKRPTRLMVSTDKPVYQPGQTIHMRALALRRADGKPLVGQEAVITIADPRGTVIFKQRAVTSGFGITSADCPLADEIIQGAYTLKCVIAGTESERTVDVKPYVLPKFRVAVDIDEPFLRPGQVFRAKIAASYFFGQVVTEGTVEVEMSAPDGGVTQHKTAAIDRNGNAVAEFRVPDRLVGTERDDGDGRLTITATVKDAGGQVEARSIHRVVTNRELRIEVLPESGVLIPGAANRIYILVTTPDGRPAAAARLSIAGVDHELRTSELGVASFELTPDAPSPHERAADVRITIAAADAAGRKASRTVNLSSRVTSGDFLLRTDAAVYKAGGTLNIAVTGAGSEPVFVDLLKDGQTVLTQVVDIAAGHGELAIDLPTDISGTLELVAYRFDASGVAAKRVRAVVVEGADDLRIAVTPDKPQYRPGDRAKLLLEVTSSAGAPQPGAVSVAAVDEAVYAVLDQSPGMERTLMTLDEQLLKPVYTLYPWASVSKATSTRQEFDRAIFSATTLDSTSNRNEVFKKLVDEGYIGEEMLEILDNPKADRMIADMQASGVISPEAAAILHGSGASTHSLNGSTWPEKVLKVQQLRRAGTEMVNAGWVALGLATVLFVIALIWVFVNPSLVKVLISVVVVAFLIGLFLPALGKARQSARQLRDQTVIRGLGEALDYAGVKTAAAARVEGGAPPRVRDWFPETLLWRPEVITDEAGRATIDVDLADSITTWRVLGSAVTRDGRLGSLNGQIAVFQPFFVDINAPVSLTRGDEVRVPIVVYNYLDSPQDVRLTVKRGDWFELDGASDVTLNLPGKAVRSFNVRMRALRVGAHELEIAAVADADAKDAIKRTIEVLSGGRAIERIVSGSLATPLDAAFDVPADLIEGSGRLLIKVYPSPLSQFVEGMEGIFQAPHGCFEQTSSTTYPNVLALQYLKQTGKAAPSVEATARQYIHLGYQRLISFEVSGGGFDWFGHPPANRLLTAYGFMEFGDMAKVRDVDPALIDRTRRWLMAQRHADGSWSGEPHGLESGLASQGGDDLIATTYIAWSVFNGSSSGDAALTRAWLESVRVDRQADPYVMALMVQALAAVGGDERPWMRRMMDVRQQSADGKQTWWSRSGGSRTAFCGSGHYADIETTALAALALLEHRGDVTAARGAIGWLISQRDGRGTWGTTQATVLALKALVAAADAPLGEPVERVIAVEVGGQVVERITIDPDQAEVLKLVDLSGRITPGPHHVVVRQERGPAAQAQVVFRAAVPGMSQPEQQSGPLAIDVRYDRDALRVGEELLAVAKVSTGELLPMVMLDLPIPPGFEPRRSDFDAMVTAGSIARYELTPRTAIVYLTLLKPVAPLTLRYVMRATMPVSVTMEAPAAYEYYNPQRKARGSVSAVRVDAAQK